MGGQDETTARDPQRIGRITADFMAIWLKHPDLRMGQLYLNLTGGPSQADPWYIEDDRLEAGIKFFMDNGRFKAQDQR